MGDEVLWALKLWERERDETLIHKRLAQFTVCWLIRKIHKNPISYFFFFFFKHLLKQYSYQPAEIFSCFPSGTVYLIHKYAFRCLTLKHPIIRFPCIILLMYCFYFLPRILTLFVCFFFCFYLLMKSAVGSFLFIS